MVSINDFLNAQSTNKLRVFTKKFGRKEILKAIEADLEDHIDDFEGNYTKRPKIKEIQIRTAYNLNAKNYELTYYAVYSAKYIYTNSENKEIEGEVWLELECFAEVLEDSVNFKVKNVYHYTKEQNHKKHGNTTVNFAPFIHKNKLDDEATAFLNQYYPQALTKPCAVPIKEIAKKMGLKLEFNYILSDKFQYFGQVCFADTTVDVFDVNKDKSKKINVKRGTILIDPDVSQERTEGCVNFTIAHELVHWHKHSLYADVMRLLSEDYVAHRCPRGLEDKPKKNWNVIESLEWQANAIAARILMPTQTLCNKIIEFERNAKANQYPSTNAYFLEMIKHLANFYKVSLQTSKYRLKDLGFDDVDNVSLHEYDFQDYTRKIDPYKAYYEIRDNSELEKLLNKKWFAYVEGYFVINHPRFIEVDDKGVAHLTTIAEENIDKCTLKFTNERINIKTSEREFSHILYRKTYEIFPKFSTAENDEAIRQAHLLADTFAVQYKRDIEIIAMDYRTKINKIMDMLHIEAKEFQEHTLLAQASYYRFREGKRPKFETLIAFCAGLDLSLEITEELMKMNGYAFSNSPVHLAYKMAITNFRGKPIDIRNEFLTKLNIEGVKALGDDIR